MIKKFKTELIVLALLFINIFISYNIDLGLYFYFKALNKSLEAVYLKDFFNNITNLGDSFWYFFLCILGVVIIIILQRTKILIFLKLNEIKNFFLYTIFILFFSGFFAQLVKHIVGRARPNYTNLEGSFGFDFFTMNSNFHSFPSGHATTIFVLSLVFSTLIPRLRYFFFAISAIIAFSRVVVGAHFVTDVIGGLIIAMLSFKIINIVIENKFKFLKLKKIKIIDQNIFFSVLVVLFLISVLLTAGSGLDLFVSSLFYRGNSQFLLQNYYSFTIFFRDILIPIILVYLLFLPIISKLIPINKLYFSYNFKLKEIFFIWITLIVNLILLINLLLKMFWGRARPGDVLQLGGKDHFTPWYEISEACSFNCSFVSGDSAVGFSLIVMYLVTNNLKYLYLSIIFGFVLGFVRIAEGGHFLSDVVFSALIVFVSSYFLKKYFFKTI